MFGPKNPPIRDADKLSEGTSCTLECDAFMLQVQIRFLVEKLTTSPPRINL